MGSEDLFHKKRKTARVNSESGKSERSKRSRNSSDYVLIVCEDSKATPAYLKAVLRDLKLSTANIKIVGKECGSDPVSVVQHAKELQQAELKTGSEYDKIYCVIDRDQHTNFSEAIKQAKDNKILIIVCVPCFEYWILLHFEYTSTPLINYDGVKKVLKKYIPNYDKGQFFNTSSYSQVLKPKEEGALTNAKQRAGELEDTASIHADIYTGYPYTNMHELIEYLRNLKPIKKY